MTPCATARALWPHRCASATRVTRLTAPYAAVLALLVSAVALVGLAHPASAAGWARPAPSDRPQTSPLANPMASPMVSPMVPTVPVMIVLDASGSMNESDAPGPRIDAAKRAVKSLVATLPSTTKVGLTVYGTGTGSTAADKAKGCTDITTLVPVSALDVPAMTTAIDRVRASGYTPIGNALRAAAKALPTQGPRSIVLVSDGEDTCAPPAPCDVAKELKKQGVDLVVHTVGFKVDATARAQLACVATSTGGTYSDASDSNQLTTALEVKVDHAITGYTTKGTRVTGAAQLSEQAPLLRPGQYLDTYARGSADDKAGALNGTTKYYTVPLPKNATLYAAATVVPPTRAAGEGAGDMKLYGVKVTLLARDGYRCDDDAYRVINGERHDPTTAVLNTDLASNRYDSRCPSEGIGILEVARRGTAYGQQALPMELVVRVEPPADTSRVPAAYKKVLPGLPQPNFGKVTPTNAGSSFNDATELKSGVTYSDRIVTGEDRFYRVALQWGQRFSYAVKETGPPSPANGVQVLAWMDFYNPMRQDVSMTGDDTTGKQWFAQRDEDPFTGSTDVPVRYTNRTSIQNGHYQLDGFYYLRLNADFASKEASTRYLVTVVVSGSPEPGPVYRPDATDPTTPPTTPSTTGPSSSPSTSPSTLDSRTTGPSSQPTTPDPNATVASSAASGGSDRGTQPVVVALAALLVLGGVGGAVLLARARRRQPPLDTQR